MALTQAQKSAKIKAIDAKIAKIEASVKTIEELRAEREWLAAAPVSSKPELTPAQKAEAKAKREARKAEKDAAAQAAKAAVEANEVGQPDA